MTGIKSVTIRSTLGRKNFYILVGLDGILIIAAYLWAFMLRFDLEIPEPELERFYTTVFSVLALKILVFLYFGLYRGMVRYTSLVDLFNIIKATLTASAVILLVIPILQRYGGYPQCVFIIDWFLSFVLIGSLRVAIRLVFAERENEGALVSHLVPFFPRHKRKDLKRLLIVGAGSAGEKMFREIRDNPQMKFEVVGFMDDDSEKTGRDIHKTPVLGSVDDLPGVVRLHKVDEILIAIPSALAAQMRRIISACEETGLKYRTTPALGELINGKVSFSSVREVSFDDLLRREPVHLDLVGIEEWLGNRTILVSGAGGSIGSELCRQISQFSPQNIILIDKTENSLFHLESEFRQNFPRTPITPILMDIRHREFLDRVFASYLPRVVFHAAAFKHVPIVELSPWEGVLNNILGSKNMVEAAHRFGVERFILISTDKAVRPSSVMGATKRVTEMYASAYAALSSTRYISVRFGNVIGSEGSVVHLFKKQIAKLGTGYGHSSRRYPLFHDDPGGLQAYFAGWSPWTRG